MMAAILDSLVGSCAKKLQEIITEEAVLILGVKEDLRELQRTMTQIQYFLSDAEQRRTEESAVNNWLGELRDAMYYADDIIDLARSEGCKLLAESPSSSRKSTSCIGRSFFTCIPNVQKRHKIAVQIRDFNAELQKISELSERYLKLQNMQPKAEVPTVKQMGTSHLVEPNLVGKETLHACRRLVELVLAHKENKAYKLGIVGTGGVGKTTLAQKIYNDQKIEGQFGNQVWICVSQNYSEAALLKEILRNFGVHHEQNETVGELSSKLATAIADKSFFIVLDDVWVPEVWTNLLRIPLHGAAAGVILVTTRHDTVAHAIGVEDMQRVDLMPEDVGWELLWKSMNINEVKDVQHLQEIGMDIVRKCGGLPLAIKVAARVLSTEDKTENEWRKFIDRSAWSVGTLPTELRGALYMSYDDLPRHLKQCFLDCGTYPEDCVMHRDYIAMSWVAEGFILEQKGQLLEDTANEYYYELIHRNLIQPDGSTFDLSKCKMHDLLRQLACYLSREESFVGDPESLGAINMSKLRRVTVVIEKDILVLPSMVKGELKVRAFQTDQKPWSVEDTFFKRIPSIRVLNLSDSLIERIPDYIGNLIHLRLLDLDGTNISFLPESAGSLMNLQVLNLSRCKALNSLPSSFIRLYNLRHLGLNGTPINHVPKGIGRLKFLNDLEGFPIGGGSDIGKTQDGWKLEELGHLLQLRRLDMIKLERATTCSTESLLTDKKYLKLLTLCCTKHPIESYSEEDVGNIEKIFEQLIPPHSLEDLSIADFFGRRFPTWLGTTHLVSVKYLKLIDCNSCVHLPPLWQLPNLKHLRIDGAAAVTKIGPEFVGCREGNTRSMMAVAFPKLESLLIEDMPNWEEWSFVEEGDAAAASMEGVAMNLSSQFSRLQVLPRLKRLELVGCPKLRALPWQLGQEATCLEVLVLRLASSLKVVEDLPFLSEVLTIAGCDDLEKVSNLPQVRDLRVQLCPNLRLVEGLGSLQQVLLTDDMREISSLWLPGLQQQCVQRHDEDLGIYPWTR